MPDTKLPRANPYKPKRNAVGRPVETVTDPAPWIKAHTAVPLHARVKGVVGTRRWTPTRVLKWMAGWDFSITKLAAAMRVNRHSLNDVLNGHVPVSRWWAAKFDTHLTRLEKEIRARQSAATVARLAGPKEADRTYVPQLYDDARRFLRNSKRAPRDANGVPINGPEPEPPESAVAD